MSPRSAFQNCGSSSRLVRRRKRPTRVMRGSSRILNIGPWASLRWRTWSLSWSASLTMVRNLWTLNSRPSRPTRGWLKITGPGLSRRMATAMISQQRRQHQQRNRRAEHVHAALEEPRPGAELGVAGRQHGDAGHVLHVHHAQAHLEQVGHDARPHACPCASGWRWPESGGAAARAG